MSRLLELVMRLAVEVQERKSEFDFDGRPLEKLSDVELLQIIAREQGMTQTKFLRAISSADGRAISNGG
jgi:hypothetical protein